MRLRVEGASSVRGGRRVFSGVSFTLTSGVFATLRGPNGSGKTSLLRVLAGLSPPEAGTFIIDKASLKHDPETYRENVVFAGHLDALKPSFTVRENLSFWTRYFGVDEIDAPAKVDAALAAFGLSHIENSPAAYCSAGQKRRLGLARLAAADRPVWLLDEPTVSLDAASVDALCALIAAHIEGGGVVLAATHVELPLAPSLILDLPNLSQGAAAPAGEAAADPFLAGDWSDA